MDHTRLSAGAGDDNVGIPDDLRCKMSDGKQWRCTALSMPDKTVCEKHYIQAKKRAENSALKASMKKKRKSLGENDSYYDSKSDDMDLPLASSKVEDYSGSFSGEKNKEKLPKTQINYSPEAPPAKNLSLCSSLKSNDDLQRDSSLYEENQRSHRTKPPSAVDSSRSKSQKMLESSPITHGGEVVDIVDARSKAEQRDTNSKLLKIEKAKKRIQKDYTITEAEILQHSGKKLKDTAAHLDVSLSTLKRIRKVFDMPRWRGEKHKDGPSNGVQGLIQSTNEVMEGPFVEQLPQQVQRAEQDSISVEQLPRPVQPVEQGLNSNPDSTRNAMAVKNDSNIVVKVTYSDRMIKFYLSVSSRKMALEKEIAKRLPLSIGSFDIKYSDEDGDWISITCDEDLDLCVSTMGSLGKSTIKMSVNLLQDS